MKKNVLIGGAWPYANNSMHVGHLAGLLPGDIIARYHRKKGDNVIYVSGTDAHGTPITERAKNEGVEPVDIANKYHEEFLKSFADLGFSYDLYGVTTSKFHKEKVVEFLKTIDTNGYLYEKEEHQDYCETCNKFLSDREMVGVCPYCQGDAEGDQCGSCLHSLEASEVLAKKCKACAKPSTQKDTKNIYFKLSAFQGIIQKLLDENKNNWRKNAANETKKYLNNGLIDRAITRTLNWGIEVPFPGYEDKVIYVWIEAVMGYLTTLQEICISKGLNYEDFIINSNNTTNYYVHGKDNIPFHTIIWPALLSAINPNYQLSKNIISSEYVNMNDEKMSKSKGNLITVNELLESFSKDTIRYYFIANNPENKDNNFSIEELIQTHNKFLVGVLGNFVNRNFSFINKKFEGKISKAMVDVNIKAHTKKLYDLVSEQIEKGHLKLALEHIIEYSVLGNKYYDETQPWIKVKEDINEFNNITYTCTYMIANLANLLTPFIPETSKKILAMINLEESSWGEIELKEDIHLNEVQLLFERIELETN